MRLTKIVVLICATVPVGMTACSSENSSPGADGRAGGVASGGMAGASGAPAGAAGAATSGASGAMSGSGGAGGGGGGVAGSGGGAAGGGGVGGEGGGTSGGGQAGTGAAGSGGGSAATSGTAGGSGASCVVPPWSPCPTGALCCTFNGKGVVIDEANGCKLDESPTSGGPVACFAPGNGDCLSMQAGSCYKRTDAGKSTWLLTVNQYSLAILSGTGWVSCDTMDYAAKAMLPACP